ncbi:MAG: aminotransferase class V-fold PLP-dependent enzyme [Cellulosilyticum sp.]|nr:aminotransferase class V-fold PLP-dependent enzyme [Cellulosilyticum sp.]
MYSFRNDYSEGAHPNILESLVRTNMEQTFGYGEDNYTLEAQELIRAHIGREDVAIHFLVGGTQTNLTAISAFLRPHEAAIAAASGHIAVHETGAIEATGHKVITTETVDGKLSPIHIEAVLKAHTDEHMVKPKLVYLSDSTEVGTIYYKEELRAIYECAKSHGLLVMIDGARLGSALMAKDNDVTLNDLAQYSDAFYIGGTKNGALLGEALVIVNDSLKEDFRYHIKQKGGLLAKGRIIALGYIELFKEQLFFDLAKHANEMAEFLLQGIKEAGYSTLTESTTNQVFPILPKDIIKELRKQFDFSDWEEIDEAHLAIRLVTSWATPKESVESFCEALAHFK